MTSSGLALVASLTSSPQALTTSLFEGPLKSKRRRLPVHSPKQIKRPIKPSELDTMIDLNAFAASIMQPHAKHFSKDLKAIKGDCRDSPPHRLSARGRPPR